MISSKTANHRYFSRFSSHPRPVLEAQILAEIADLGAEVQRLATQQSEGRASIAELRNALADLAFRTSAVAADIDENITHLLDLGNERLPRDGRSSQ